MIYDNEDPQKINDEMKVSSILLQTQVKVMVYNTNNVIGFIDHNDRLYATYNLDNGVTIYPYCD